MQSKLEAASILPGGLDERLDGLEKLGTVRGLDGRHDADSRYHSRLVRTRTLALWLIAVKSTMYVVLVCK